mgnify:FL=1
MVKIIENSGNYLKSQNSLMDNSEKRLQINRIIHKRVICFLIAAILVFCIRTVEAQQNDYITDEKIISYGSQCDTGETEAGIFVDGYGSMMRHCIKRGTFDNNGYYVVNSYFEFGEGLCSDGGDDVGFFNDALHRLIYLCVDRQRGGEIPQPTNESIVRNATITNSSECLSGFHDTGIDIEVQGYTIKHCALGGKAGGGLESVTRERCEIGYAGTIPLLERDQCVYDLNSPDGGSEIGEIWGGATLTSGGEECPKINCTCMGVGSFSTNGWNCTALEQNVTEEPPLNGECLFSNQKWADENGEILTSINEDENLIMVAEVTDVCEIDKEVKCDVFKYEGLVREDVPHTQAFGKVIQKEGSEKKAYCDWTAIKLEGTENDIDQQYYFKMWFADNQTYKSDKSEIINILNKTAEPPGEITVNWSSSIQQSRKNACPTDKFAVKINGWKISCAEFIKSDGGSIIWGSEREVKSKRKILRCGILGNCDKLDCEGNEALVGAFDRYKIKCAVMEDEEGNKVGIGDIHIGSNGCNKDEVIVGVEKGIEDCAGGLIMGGEGRPVNNNEDDQEENEGLFGGGGLGGGMGGGFISSILPMILPLVMKFIPGLLGG